eukprot:CAMPEP_0204016158 /NCGR_PEP_ID=MMETSP0360-20130528/26550_1 /ASSEMBLY_ACC=CAM_ASM_000342 /TAXON_ID=268821 /ORGANISM="Scrippsiella Hangoei, Strain SHTV-5" /LENGTH=89 /DNA_ID=CAMNT_0050959141 /DNA_START=66 /DNA_END=335 /DNA_ORIENTATION=+
MSTAADLGTTVMATGLPSATHTATFTHASNGMPVRALMLSAGTRVNRRCLPSFRKRVSRSTSSNTLTPAIFFKAPFKIPSCGLPFTGAV